MVLGLGGALVAGTLAMAQLERSANRILGSREDRPGVWRYVAAFALALSGGVLLAAGGLVLAGGEAIAEGMGWGDELRPVWSVIRWPIGVVVVAVSVFLLYRAAPRKQAAPTRALVAGAVVAVVLWVAMTALLALYFSASDQTNQTHGPLLSVIALLVWSGLTSLSLHLGLAVTSELVMSMSPEDRTIRLPDAPEATTTRPLPRATG